MTINPRRGDGQVYDRASLGAMLATRPAAECVQGGAEALAQCGREARDSLMLALPPDHTQ